jgi:purine nucleosidase
MDRLPEVPVERSLVIDTDTASDDAVALLMAARHPKVRIRAVTTVAGNVPLDLATRNALVTLELAGAADVPVHEGLAKPLLRAAETAQFVHGQDGMSEVALASPTRSIAPTHAVDALVRIAADEPGEHVLVTLGPLSNVATAILLLPDLLTRFAAVVSMAGAFDGVGNVHPVGEFNVWADPEAARIVLDASGTVTFVGWDMSRRFAVITPDEQAELRSLGHLGRFVVDINRRVDEFSRLVSGFEGFDLPDPIAMAVAIDDRVALEREAVHVDVGTDDIGRGGTFVDRRLGAEPNAVVVSHADEARFKAMLTQACTE